MDALVLAVLLGCIAAVSLGLAKFVMWCVDRRVFYAGGAARQNQFVAHSVSELRRLEIEATKRGNLLAAAELADEQERAA
ncbi:hypothetical protein N5D13_00325 [Stenotrophomonas maltophilia]|uniref:hypothetical protein n=1 Tax=Stenotrophomonas maltophilia TaxID=40324 RepID=UPI00244D36A8|nr:hypothetical protein [Stenotrophomonas maltophilia]MDH0071434.1 hypothetical protein [Stenotrophomonas maltophilia]MDH0104264.1 hypothetical protein [Stenotrophomonas maltophilia]MDH0330055.1 hypothetical protein [Stenotrophomonas maltophilia]MDH0631674.1 hypothetical protein [Stenotrophomonas maltophilia]MDH0641059.1 hypothetical protein [Stenotrophomonas maltophilia]